MFDHDVHPWLILGGTFAAYAEVGLVFSRWWLATAGAAACLAMAIWLTRKSAGRPTHHECRSLTTRESLLCGLAAMVAVGLVVTAGWLESGVLLFVGATLVAALAFRCAGRLRWSRIALQAMNIAALTGGIALAVHRYAAIWPSGWLPLRLFSVLLWPLQLLGSHEVSASSEYLVVAGVRIHETLIFQPFLVSVSLALAAVCSIPSRSSLRRFLIACAVAALAVQALIVLTAVTHGSGYLAHSWFTFASALGYAMVVVLLWRPRGLRSVSNRGLIASYSFAGLAVLCVGLVNGFGNNVASTGRILIDEGHGKWETTNGTVDTLSYGRPTTYNYVLLRKWLESRYQVGVLNGPVPAALNCDVLIVKVPTERFKNDEVHRVERWVRGGGSLIVIGDHTNLFGSTWIANDLLAAFGIRMRDDATLPLSGPDYIHRATWWNMHRALRGLGDFPFMTSCSVEAARSGAAPLMVCGAVVSEHAEYSNDRFFGELEVSPDDRLGPLAAGVYVHVGKGSVIVFGDSTIWSSFSFFFPPYKEFLDGLIQLGLEGDQLRTWLSWLAAGTALAGFVLVGRRRGIRPGLVCGLLVMLWSPLVPARARVHLRAHDRGATRMLLVDAHASRFNLSTDIRTGAAVDLRNYSAFLGTLPRIGIWPEIQQLDYDRVGSDEAVLALCPAEAFSQRQLIAIEGFLRRGGKMLLFLDTTRAWPPPGRELVERFGADVTLETIPERWGGDAGPLLPEHLLGLPFSVLYAGRRQPAPSGRDSASLRPSLIHTEPLLVDADGMVIYGRRPVGEGALYVFVRPEAFSQYVLGDVWAGVELDKLKRDLYANAYNIVDTFYDED